MDNTVQNWWAFPLALLSPKIFGTVANFTLPSITTALFSFALLAIITWLATSLLHWTHPGGPAWGRYWKKSNPSSYLVIPGPRGLPFIGSMRLKSGLSHHTLNALANRLDAKRLMAFSLGEIRAIVSSHPDVAKEILNSPVFADRPVNHSAYGLMFHRAIGFAPYGVYWRTLRRIASCHLFSPSQIEVSACHRASIASQMTNYLHSTSSKIFQVRGVLRRSALYYIMQSVFGKRYNLCSSDPEVEQLLWMVDEGYKLLGMSNWSDYFQILAGLDLQHIKSRCSELMPKVNELINSIIEKHRSNPGSRENQDFVDILLSLQDSEVLSDSDIAAVLWVSN
jgi:cytochrome P450 family 78 subfamily A